MTQVDDLQKKYPTVPREVIVKSELLRHGLKDSPALHRAGYWMRSLGTYQSYDHDVTMKDAARVPERLQPGFIKAAQFLYLKDGLAANVMRSSTSPYEIKDIGFGRFGLYEGEELVGDVFFQRDPKPWPEEPRTSKGTPVTSLCTLMTAQCAVISPVRYCEYFASGEECKFCSFNAGQADARAIGLDRPTTIDPVETIEAYKIIATATKLKDLRVECGGLKDDKHKLNVLLGFVGKLTSAVPYKPNITARCEPMGREDFQRLKDAGVNCVGMHMEVWDPQLFAEVCPGKAKYSGYERYKEAIFNASDVMGAGNVAVNFVGGVTLMPANGHTTWQESRDSMIEGVRWVIGNGALPSMSPVRMQHGSVYGADPSLKAKRPPTEYYLDVLRVHHESMLESDLYTKLNRYLYCPLDCAAWVLGADIGILSVYGDTRKWLASQPLQHEPAMSR